VGSQKYHSEGNAATVFSFLGATLPPRFTFTYSIDASVKGTIVSGSAQFHLSGKDNGKGPSGSHVDVEGQMQLTGMVPAVGLPITTSSNPLGCLPFACTSEIPGFFLGSANIKGSLNGAPLSLAFIPMLIESAYLNPFGGRIFIGTPDGMISIAAMYNSAISHWDNVKTRGDVAGSAAGKFTITSGLTENLLSGKEEDHGQIALSSFSGSFASLNSAGEFHGTSMIPPVASGSDCTGIVSPELDALFGTALTLPPGTCTFTGSQSEGSFTLQSLDNKATIKGSYVIEWSIPAIAFVGGVTATIHQK